MADKKMTKKELSDKVAEKLDLTKKETLEIFNAILDEVSEVLIDGGVVELSGFGRFSIKKRKARNGVNPATGEPILIEGTNAVSFKPSKILKEAIKQD